MCYWGFKILRAIEQTNKTSLHGAKCSEATRCCTLKSLRQILNLRTVPCLQQNHVGLTLSTSSLVSYIDATFLKYNPDFLTFILVFRSYSLKTSGQPHPILAPSKSVREGINPTQVYFCRNSLWSCRKFFLTCHQPDKKALLEEALSGAISILTVIEFLTRFL